MSRFIITCYTAGSKQHLRRPVRIAHVSDLHERDCDDIMTAIKKEHPDLIFVTGDTFERYDNRPQYEFERRPIKRVIINVIHYSNFLLTKLLPKKAKANEENVLRFLKEAVTKPSPSHRSI